MAFSNFYIFNEISTFFLFFLQISKWVEDETTFCLMNLILLFNSSESRRQLESPEIVESHQIYYTELLYRYLLSRYPKAKARAKLAEGICIVSHCRELHQLAILKCSMIRKESESSFSNSSGSGGEDNWKYRGGHWFVWFCISNFFYHSDFTWNQSWWF